MPATQPEFDFGVCEAEPIHLLEQVQGYGCLLVLDSALQVLQAHSENTARLLGLSGPPVLETGGAAPCQVLEQVVTAARRTAPGVDQVLDLPAGRFRLFWQRMAGRAVIELEPVPRDLATDSASCAVAEQVVLAALEDAGGEGNLYRLADQLARSVGAVTGYDRVMVYRFHPDWSGEVIAETRRDDLVSYLGLRYPASDIPPQARRLYTVNLLRMIADVNGVTSGLVRTAADPDPAPIDLSLAGPRGVSGFHLEYLRNMGVAATLTATIIVDGKLWGLVACHHYTPLLMPWYRRAAAGRLAARGAQRITQAERVQVLEAEQRAQAFVHALDLSVARGQSPLAALIRRDPSLLDAGQADGMALLADGTVASLGATPSAMLLRRCLILVGRQPVGVLVAYDCLGDLQADANGDAREEDGTGAGGNRVEGKGFASLPDESYAGGILGICLRSGPEPLVMAVFRREQVHDVLWGGDPNHPVVVDDLRQSVSPRRSFALWRETVRGRCRPWGPVVKAVLKAVADRLGEQLPSARETLAIFGALDLSGTRDPDPLNASTDGLMVVRRRRDASGEVRGGRVMGVNRAFRVLFDRTGEGLAGSELDSVLADLGLPADLAGMRVGCLRAITWWSKRDGPQRLEVDAANLSLVQGAEGGFQYLILTFRNRTREMRTSEALITARDQALESARGQRLFLANLNHELRTPLNAIIGFSDLLKLGGAFLDEARVREYAGDIGQAATHLLRVIVDLLDMTELEAATRGLTETVVDLRTVLDRSLAVAVDREGGGEDTVDGLWSRCYPSSPVPIRVDEQALIQAFAHIAGNVLKYCPSGAAAEVILVRESHGGVRVTFRDRGPGLPPELRDTVLKAFHQGRNVYRRGSSGAGLGLPLARALVELHGGALTLSSDEGSGTTVQISLPGYRVVAGGKADLLPATPEGR